MKSLAPISLPPSPSARALPPLPALRAFEAAGRLGRMTAAANELAVTPGAISKQVKQLEEFLGTPLFAGTKYHPVLTPAGAALLPVLTEAFAQIKTGVRAIQTAGSQVVTVSCLNTFAMRWLIPRLYQFNALHPTIDVRLSTTAQDGAESMNHDVVITVVTATVNQTNEPNTSNVQLLFEEKIGPVLSPTLAQRYTLHNPSDLRGKPILQTRTRHEAWKLWCQRSGHKIAMTAGPVFDHYYFSIEAALAGLGVCVVPLHLVADDVEAGRLMAPFGFVASGYVYQAQNHTALHGLPSASAQLFMTWLSQTSQQWAQGLAS